MEDSEVSTEFNGRNRVWSGRQVIVNKAKQKEKEKNPTRAEPSVPWWREALAARELLEE